MTTEQLNQLLNFATVIILAAMGWYGKIALAKQAASQEAAKKAAEAAEKAAESAKEKAVEAKQKAEVTSTEVTEIKHAVNSERTELLRKLEKAQADHKADVAALVKELMAVTSRNAVLEEIAVPTVPTPPADSPTDPPPATSEESGKP